jgi:Flp pilus assembly protein TadG
MLKRFLKDKRANIAMMFGVLAIPLIAATGAAIDYSHAYEQRQVVQDALDAASLAANKLIGLATDDEIFAEAQAFFDANTDDQINTNVVLHMTIDGGSVHLWTELAVPTYFLGIVGVDDINFDIGSTSVAGAATYEVVMVLDNSTSMRGSKISSLKTAATDLVNSLFALAVSNPADDPVRVGLVPFAASVNVGSNYATAAWMDTTGIGPNAGINFDDAFTNRFALFDALPNVEWGGCVEARTYPYDVNDTTPTATVPATLFEPMFAPDEPDPTYNFNNDYLDDEGGTCETNAETSGSYTCDVYSGYQWWWCTYYHNPAPVWVPGSPAGADYCDSDDYACLQARTCKYQGVSDYGFDGLGEGPNRNCTANALTPMTTSQSALTAAINAMDAPFNPGAYTDIEQGVVWGWRLLSSNSPFTEGRDYGTSGNHKILIVMTDGANTYYQPNPNNINRSEYMAYNYVAQGLLGTTSTNNNTVVDAMNDRTLEACANVQDTEITVYTIAFEVDDDDAAQILHDCASDESKAFDADNEEELIATFRLIAQDIATLRIAE